MVDMDDRIPEAKPLLCLHNESRMAYKKVLVCTSLALYAGILAGVACMYRFFPMNTCTFNPLGITFTLLMTVINTAISVSKIAPHGALLTSAIVSSYTTWLCFSAISSMPWSECNPAAAEESIATSVVGIVLASFTVAYYAFTVGRRDMRAKQNDSPAPDALTVKVEDGDDPMDEVE